MSEKTKICPFCGGEVIKTAKKCKHCKKWLPSEERPKIQKQNEEKNMQDSKLCPYCCRQVPLQARKCPHCGEWIERQEPQGVGCFLNIVYWGVAIIGIIIAFFMILAGVGNAVDGVFSIIILALIGLGIYFLPTEIALAHKHRQTLIIFVINLFLGCSGIAWIATLVWALSDKD